MAHSISWEQVLDNLKEFSTVLNNPDSIAYKRMSQYFHWYYFPDEDCFAPAKFLGYPNTTIENYDGDGHGGEAIKALAPYFDMLESNSEKFRDLYTKLVQFVPKKINVKTRYGTGGIYILKEKYQKGIIYLKQSLLDLEAIDSENDYSEEGSKKGCLTSYYERDPKLRAKAINIHGTKCKACGFDFEKVYGIHGKDYIEVHHLKPLYTLGKIMNINAKLDMTVLCSNCHRMVHRKKDAPLTLEDLKSKLIQRKRL